MREQRDRPPKLEAQAERDQIGDCEPDDVGGKQKPAHEPATPLARRGQASSISYYDPLALRDGDRVLRCSTRLSPPP